MKKTENHFEWKIPKFLSLNKSGKCVFSSPSFTFVSKCLHLVIFVPTRNNDRLGIFLPSDITPINDTDVTVSISIKHKSGMLDLTKTSVDRPNLYHGMSYFLSGSTLRNWAYDLLPENTLTIVCGLKTDLEKKETIASANDILKEKSVVTTEEHQGGISSSDSKGHMKLIETIAPANEANILEEKSVVTTEKHQGGISCSDIKGHMKLIELDTLSDNFKSLFVNKDSCDVILRVQEKEFNAHKLILKARSSVFASMFNHDTLENQTGIINIPDCDADSFHYFLEYLYCGKLEDITFQDALHLYRISDKYNVQKLKCFCVEYMEQYLTEDNVCDVIILADMHEESSLLTAAQDFFNNNADKVTETIQWENLLKSNYRLANKVIKGLTSKLKSVNNQSSK